VSVTAKGPFLNNLSLGFYNFANQPPPSADGWSSGQNQYDEYQQQQQQQGYYGGYQQQQQHYNSGGYRPRNNRGGRGRGQFRGGYNNRGGYQQQYGQYQPQQQQQQQQQFHANRVWTANGQQDQQHFVQAGFLNVGATEFVPK